MSTPCSNCAQMKTENIQLRKQAIETHKNYTEVVNLNLELRRKIEQLEGTIKTHTSSALGF